MLRVSFSLCTTYTCMKSQCFFTVEFKEFDNTAKEKISKVLQQFSRFCCFLWVWETVPFLFVYQFFVLRRILFNLQQRMLEPECWKAELKSTKQIFSEQKDILLLLRIAAWLTFTSWFASQLILCCRLLLSVKPNYR